MRSRGVATYMDMEEFKQVEKQECHSSTVCTAEAQHLDSLKIPRFRNQVLHVAESPSKSKLTSYCMSQWAQTTLISELCLLEPCHDAYMCLARFLERRLYYVNVCVPTPYRLHAAAVHFIWGGAARDRRTYHKNRYIHCAYDNRLCGARSGSPQ